MTPEAVIFWVLAVITVGGAAVVVFARSLIYNAFALLFTFFGVAGFYVLLGADFLAATQLLIYVGGILVLLLFGVMLTHKLYNLDIRSEVNQVWAGLAVCFGVFIVFFFKIFLKTEWATRGVRVPAPTTEQLGRAFLGEYLLPFEAASLLLLVALMGAAMIVRRKKAA